MTYFCLNLHSFMNEISILENPETTITVAKKQMYIESYGCAMNFSDSEIIGSIMAESGYEYTNDEFGADVIFLNTCAIRDNAEQKIRDRLKHLRHNKKKNSDLIIGVLGCMAERLKTKLLEEEKLVDIVAGPDSYRDLPKLVAEVEDGSKAINVLLSREETYAEISPLRLNTNGVSAFISIMRGCDNMCSFCVVPFTRGRERSRSAESIVQEARQLSESGYKEITLLGQNVDSYLWFGGGPKIDFKKADVAQQENAVNFAQLLEMVAIVDPNMRVRFSTSHPKDISDDVIYTMLKYDNICNYIHLPAQSGNSRVLEAMNRTYTREWYISKVERIRELIPECGISCDIISGFCTETEEEHKDTLTLIEECKFLFSYMYKYSERPGTLAAKKMTDDVSEEEKSRRLSEIIVVQNRVSLENNEKLVGKTMMVLADGVSKKSDNDLTGRNEQNMKVIFPKEYYKIGDFVKVKIERVTTISLIGVTVIN
ncbi:MAG: tRNA (N6-isopentenyl adenosine(37)-C2)-methylthiotransferase MiaB [Bacteroidetes bacterium]|nr:tRNA (N6-isopentenyl adenosine(37)-C2)-methylthiotransferase MiaB [Bacteroidota bacterium]